MFHGTIGVEAELDEEFTSRPRKSLTSILDKVSERMEESAAMSESDVRWSDLEGARVEKRSGLDMLFGGVQREVVDLSRALLSYNMFTSNLVLRTAYPETS